MPSYIEYYPPPTIRYKYRAVMTDSTFPPSVKSTSSAEQWWHTNKSSKSVQPNKVSVTPDSHGSEETFCNIIWIHRSDLTAYRSRDRSSSNAWQIRQPCELGQWPNHRQSDLRLRYIRRFGRRYCTAPSAPRWSPSKIANRLAITPHTFDR